MYKTLPGIFSVVWLLSALALTLTCTKTPSADLVIYNGKIATVDNTFSTEEAVAVRKGRIIFVGSNADVQPYLQKAAKVIDLSGKLLLPGLIDSHAHLHSLGTELNYLNITGTASFQEIIDLVAEKVKTVRPGTWILGGRWDHTNWPDKKFPVHDALSAVSPYNPVFLSRVDGNSGFANEAALASADITKDTPDPSGGKIIRKWNHEPTGVLINQAMNLVKSKMPEKSSEQFETEFLAAVKSCNAVGLTGVHEAGVGPGEIQLYKRLIDDDQLTMRIYAMLGSQETPVFQVDDFAEYFKSQRLDTYHDHMLSVRSIKLFFDGALGSRGAAFFDDYADDPGNNGLLRVTPEYITKVSNAALKAGMGVNTHCIGIRGNRLCLDSYEKALVNFPGQDHRFRIEHAQIVRDEDIAKFAELNVIPAMQPTHCTSDMNFVEDRVGPERVKGSYAWRSFLNAGMMIPCGSDFPVESNNPLFGIYAAVTRQDHNGQPAGGWFPNQRMTIEEAVRGFTIWGAYAAHQETVLGSVEVGKLADFTILDKDILTIDPSEILKTTVQYTIVGGKIVYAAE